MIAIFCSQISVQLRDFMLPFQCNIPIFSLNIFSYVSLDYNNHLLDR